MLNAQRLLFNSHFLVLNLSLSMSLKDDEHDEHENQS